MKKIIHTIPVVKWVGVLLLLGLTAVLAGCGDDGDAAEGDFENALFLSP